MFVPIKASKPLPVFSTCSASSSTQPVQGGTEVVLVVKGNRKNGTFGTKEIRTKPIIVQELRRRILELFEADSIDELTFLSKVADEQVDLDSFDQLCTPPSTSKIGGGNKPPSGVHRLFAKLGYREPTPPPPLPQAAPLLPASAPSSSSHPSSLALNAASSTLSVCRTVQSSSGVKTTFFNIPPQLPSPAAVSSSSISMSLPLAPPFLAARSQLESSSPPNNSNNSHLTGHGPFQALVSFAPSSNNAASPPPGGGALLKPLARSIPLMPVHSQSSFVTNINRNDAKFMALTRNSPTCEVDREAQAPKRRKRTDGPTMSGASPCDNDAPAFSKYIPLPDESHREIEILDLKRETKKLVRKRFERGLETDLETAMAKVPFLSKDDAPEKEKSWRLTIDEIEKIIKQTLIKEQKRLLQEETVNDAAEGGPSSLSSGNSSALSRTTGLLDIDVVSEG